MQFKINDYFIYIVLGIVIYSACDQKTQSLKQYTYLNNVQITDPVGRPKNKRVYYFPYSINNLSTGIDSVKNRYYSSILKAFNEPVLYNQYLSNDIFRLTILASWQPVKMIKLIKSDNNIIVIIKTFKKKYEFFPHESYSSGIDPDTGKKIEPDDTIFTYSFRKAILMDEWNNVAKKIDAGQFWKLNNVKNDLGPDGTRVILEGRTKDKYWFANRWSPSSFNNGEKYKALCDELVKIAGEKINWNDKKGE